MSLAPSYKLNAMMAITKDHPKYFSLKLHSVSPFSTHPQFSCRYNWIATSSSASNTSTTFLHIPHTQFLSPKTLSMRSFFHCQTHQKRSKTQREKEKEEDKQTLEEKESKRKKKQEQEEQTCNIFGNNYSSLNNLHSCTHNNSSKDCSLF